MDIKEIRIRSVEIAEKIVGGRMAREVTTLLVIAGKIEDYVANGGTSMDKVAKDKGVNPHAKIPKL